MHSRVRRIRRIITGHDATVRSTILSDAPSPHIMTTPGTDDFASTDLWKTCRAPADNSGSEDACKPPITLAPLPTGSVFRIVQFPPGKHTSAMERRRRFCRAGDSGAKAVAGTAERHEGMHRTDSTDYAIVIEGEIFGVLGETQTLMHAGDVLVQRGTDHSWSNRSNAPCLVTFVLVDAAPVGG
jgi:hypothetical protein